MVFVKVIKPPLQIEFGVALNDTVGFGNTVTVFIIESLHPLAVVTPNFIV